MNAVPPKLEAAAPRLALLLLGGAALAAAAVVFFFNPATTGFYPVCHFHQLTGLQCPGCGMTRGLHALLHGDFLTALRDNALLVGLSCAAALRGGWFALNHVLGRRNPRFIQERWLWWLLALALVFSVLRNLPAFAFLSPTP